MAKGIRRDPINKLLPLLIDSGDDYGNEWMRLNRRRKEVPPELENDANRLVQNLRKTLKR
jgi:hypothetical protein